MADFYLDTSAIGNEYQVYADTPTTWGVPQDGNGKAGPGHSAAVAIATIDCASASASGAGQLSLLGQTVSSTLTGSGATLATNIAAAINAYATAVIATYSQALLPLNKLVYARVNTGVNTQVQIMMRIAGVDWNGMVPASAGTWATAPTMGAFAGGANGPFGYFINDTTVFGKTKGTYGVRVQKSAGVADPAGATDYIWSRTKRGTNNLTCSLSLSTTAYLQAQASRQFIFDAGNTWVGESGTFTLAVSFTAAVAFSLDSLSSGGYIYCDADAEGGFKITGASSVVGATLLINTRNSSGGKIRYTNAVFQEMNTNVTIQVCGVDGSQTRGKDCWFKLMSGHALFSSTFSNFAWLFEGGGVEFSGLSADVPSLYVASASQVFVHYRLKDFTCRDTGGVWKVTTPLSNASAFPYNSAINCEFENVSGFRAPSFGFPAYTGGRPMMSGYYQSADGDRPSRAENQIYTVDFMDDGTFPNAGAQLPSGNYYSLRCTWITNISRDVECTPFTRHFFSRSQTGAKQITLEMLCSDTVTPKTGDMYMTVSYKDNTGVRRIERTLCSLREDLLGTDAALAAGSVTWTYNGLTGYSPKKLTMTTAYQVAINTSVTVSLTLCGTPSANTSIYVHPDIAIVTP